MIKILIINSLETNNKPQLEVFSSDCPVEIVFLEETVDLDGDVVHEGNNYYIKTYIPWQEVKKMAPEGGLVELVKKSREFAKRDELAILDEEYQKLQAEHDELEEKISANLEKQNKLEKGED